MGLVQGVELPASLAGRATPVRQNAPASQILTMAGMLAPSGSRRLTDQIPRGEFTLSRPAYHRSLAFRIGPEMRFIFHGLGSRTTARRVEAGLLNPSDPGACLMEAMEDINWPFVCGGGGELASEGDWRRRQRRSVRDAAQGLCELSDVCRSQVEVCAGDLDDFGETANAAFGEPLRRAAHLVRSKRARATIATSRCSGELST